MKVLIPILMGLWVVFASAAVQSPAGKEKQDKESAHMVNNAWGNLYKFHQSRAHYRNRNTYLAWVGPNNHPYVSVYSHKKNEWSSHERVGTNLISPKDYHGNPSILIDREGFLHVFYGGHNKKMRYSRSSKPLSNDDWQDYTSRLPLPTVAILNFSQCPTARFIVFTAERLIEETGPIQQVRTTA
mgnify:CR=1 FL=1